MKKILAFCSLVAAVTTAHAAFDAAPGTDVIDMDSRPYSVAVFGDWPYSQLLLDNAPRLLDSVNADATVRNVIHVGDIHSGSMPCTSAGILPPISTSNPGWNQKVFAVFQKFSAPVIYTPGDNEWTDCHKSKESASGAPLKELAAVRGLFYSVPGRTLGVNAKPVITQATAFDPAYPADAQFVENVMWREGRVVFVTLNMPGSNNDGLNLPWTGVFADSVAQGAERDARTAADIRWLEAAFAKARDEQARGIVIALQADMWDPAAVGTDGLDGYTPFVQRLADLALAFGRPVLLLNGDSHLYGAKKPLADPSSATGLIHHAPAVPNLTRITVQGSTSAPAEWLKLVIDPRRPELFQWSNVPYCANPASSTCQ